MAAQEANVEGCRSRCLCGRGHDHGVDHVEDKRGDKMYHWRRVGCGAWAARFGAELARRS